MNINIVPDNSINRVHLSQGDIGRTLQFNLYDGALAYTPTAGSTIKIQGTKPSGYGFSVECTWSGSTVTATTTEGMTDEEGQILTELKITSEDETVVLGTSNFLLCVEKNPHLDSVTDASVAQAIQIELRLTTLEATVSSLQEELGELEETVDAIDTTIPDNSITLAKLVSSLRTTIGEIDYLGDGLLVENNMLYLTHDGEVLGEGISLSSMTGGLSFNGGYVDEDGYLHLTYDGTDIEGFDPFYVGTGGSGGSSGSRLVFAMYTAAAISVLESSGEAEISFRFTSTDTETETATGNGNLAIYVGGILKENRTVAQGDTTIDVFDYLTTGSNTVKLVLTDSYGATATRTITVTVDTFSLAWNLGDTAKNEDDLTVYITPTGSGEKTIYLLVDGTTYSTQTVSTSGRRMTFTITLNEGAHVISAYGTMTSNSVTMTSNTLVCAVAQTVSGSSTVVVAAKCTESTIAQYTTISIPYRAIDPSNNPTTVEYLINSVVYSSESVDQTEHTFTYRPSVSGTLVIGIKCGTVVWSTTLTVTAISGDIAEVTSDLALKVDPNTITDLATFNYNNVTLTMSSGFDTHNGGLTTDDDGIRCIKVVKGDTLTIGYKLFGFDFRQNGADFKIIYKVENASDFEASVISCLSGGIGIDIEANKATLTSEQSSLELQTCEGYKTELEFNVEPSTEDRIMMFWESGTPAKAAVYGSNDNFAQSSSVNITVGSDDADVYLYLLRAYTRDLTVDEVKANFCIDGEDATEIMDRYDRNQVYDGSGTLDPDLVASVCPNLHVLTWHAAGISTSKTQSVTGYVTHKYVNGGTRHSWSATNVTQKAQGTSSLGYVQAGCNEDFKFNNGFVLDDDSSTISTYAMTDDSIGVDYFNFKTNVASQEHINNILLSDWYNTYQPYLRQQRVDNSKVRDTIEGHMAVMFFHNTGNSSVDIGPYTVGADETILYSLGCLNNSKKNTDVFDYDDAVIEVNNNTSDQCRFKDDDLTDETWDDDGNFQFRYVDSSQESAMKTNWQNFLSFVVSCDADNAPNTAFSTVQTINGQAFSVDNAAYRKAKWTAYAEDYMVLDSVLYHQLFTLVFSEVDNRAKNTFWAYDNTEEKWTLVYSYDNDTAMGNDNEGGLTLKYGYMDTDTIGTRDVFNAADSTVFAMNRYCFADELQAMYIDRENAGAWDLDTFANLCDTHQAYACESLWIEDVLRKDIDTYRVLGTSAYLPMLNGQKRLQRRQFLHYQRPFMSGYFIGSYAVSNSATIRGYTPSIYSGVTPASQMTITPYSDLWILIRAGSTNIKQRAYAGTAVTVSLGVANMNDTEIYIRNASFIQDLGSLACLYPGYIDISGCTRLKRAEIGSSVSGYSNTNMTELTVTNAKSLEYLNVENCPNLVQELDLSNNINLQELYTRGSGVTGVTFADWGRIETAYLNAIAAIYAHDLQYLSNITFSSYTGITTLNIADCSGIDTLTIVSNASNLARIRLTDVSWSTTVSLYDTLMAIYDASGIDDDGYNTSHGVLTGSIYFSSISQTKYNTLVSTFPDVTFTYGELLAEYTVTFENYDGTVLYTESVERGGTAHDPVLTGLIETPTKPSSVEYVYTFYGWSSAITNILQNTTVTATYAQAARTYTVTYVDWDNTVLDTVTGVAAYGSCSYSGSTPTRTGYIWTGWDTATTSIVADTTVTAVYKYPTLPSTNHYSDMSDYDYAYSDDDSDTSAYTFGELYAIIKTGMASTYLPTTCEVKLVPDTDVITDTSLVFKLHSVGHYELADGSGMSHADFYMTGVLTASRKVNSSNTNVGGWDSSELRTWMNGTLYPALPVWWQQLIESSYTLASAGNQSSNITISTDYLRIPSHAEVGFDTTAVPYCNEVSSSASEVTFSQYTNNSSRIKKTYNGTGSAQAWWLRSAEPSSSTHFRNVYNGGNANNNNASYSYFVCVGFSA